MPGVHRGLLLLAALLLATRNEAEESCKGLFSPETSLIGNIVVIKAEYTGELTSVDELLLTVTWKDNILGEPDQNTGTDTIQGREYLQPTVDFDGLSLTTTVKTSMRGLPDFPTNVTDLVLQYDFPALDDSFVCTIRMIFPLEDQNTQSPSTISDTYSVSVREDFPKQLTIPNLQVQATDYDGSAPNNELSVSFEDGCPIKAEEDTYDAAGAATVVITFSLTQDLDYDVMDNPTLECQATLSDHGTDPEGLSSTFSITINVESFPDEMPVFEEPIYSTVLEQLEAPDGVLEITPSALLAVDGDVPPDSITYTMLPNTPDDSWEKYFSIDEQTAEVSQIKDLTEDLLTDYSVNFVVTATDSSGDIDTTILEIVLPPAPTTTSTITTVTTTTEIPTDPPTTPTCPTSPPCTTLEPPTCPPYTTLEPPTCPPCTTLEPPTCPPCTTLEPPTCPTCQPCPTTPSMSTLWTTLVTDFSTSDTETTTFDLTTTDSTSTCPPCTTVEPPTCPPCTTLEPPTCPPYTTLEPPTCPPCTTLEPPTCPPYTTEEPPTCSPCTTLEPPTCPPCTTLEPPTCPPCTTVNPTCSTEILSSTEAESSTTPTTLTQESEGTTTAENPTGTTSDIQPESSTESTSDATSHTTDEILSSTITETTDEILPSTITEPTDEILPSTITETTDEILPSTITETTDDPTITSTLDGSTHNPTGTTTASVPTTSTTEKPSGPLYKFQYQAYSFQPFTDTEIVGRLKVVSDDDDQTPPADVAFSWSPDNNEDVEKMFPLDPETGEISMNPSAVQGGTPYDLKAVAEVSGQTIPIDTQVFITVREPLDCNSPFMATASLKVSVNESSSNTSLKTFDTKDDEYCICLTELVTPLKYKDNFKMLDCKTLQLVSAIDRDDGELAADGSLYVSVRVQAVDRWDNSSDPCAAVVFNSGDLMRSDVIVLVEVLDENDETPKIVSPSGDLIRVGYPNNPALREMAGPILTLEVEDPDSVGELVFSISGEHKDLFVVDNATGELYLPPSSSCEEGCELNIQVSDGENDVQERPVQVYSIDMSYIFDLSMDMATPEQIEQYLRKLSKEIELDLQLLYTSLVDTVTVKQRGRARRRRSVGKAVVREDAWSIVAHIYGFDEEGDIVTLKTLNEKLSAAGESPASDFSEKATFEPPKEDANVVGYQVAVGVLSTLLAVVLITIIALYLVFRHKQRGAPKAGTEATSVATLGSAYPNLGYDSNEMKKMGSVSSSNSSSHNSHHSDNMFQNHENSDATIINKMDHDHVYADPVKLMHDQRPEGAVVDEKMIGSSPSHTQGGAYNYDVAAERKSSTHSLGGLRRIDLGPAPDGQKSSPYLSGEEGDYTASRAADTSLPSFTAYSGGAPTPAASLSSSYKPVHGNADDDKIGKQPIAVYTPVYGNNLYEKESRNKDRDKSVNDKVDSYKPTFNVSPQFAPFPVRSKREPPNLSSAAPAKPIMKVKLHDDPAKPIMKNTISTSAEVHQIHDAAASTNGSSGDGRGAFSKLNTSPPLKKKTKESSAADQEEINNNLKASCLSDADTTDSELSSKKSVVFKVLVDQKEIKNREQQLEEEVETVKM